MKIRLLTLAIAGITLAGTAVAAPYAPFDVRSAGMGGTGVASAKAASAALFNPAMLSSQVEGDKFQFVLGAGASAADEDEMFDQIDQLQLTIDALDTQVTQIAGMTVNLGVQYPELAEVSALATTLNGQLTGINNDSLIAGLGTGLGVGVPGKNLGVGIFVSGSGNVVATPLIAPNDISLLNRYATIFANEPNGLGGVVTPSEFGDPANNDLFAGNSTLADVEISDFSPDSQVNGLVVALVEYGVGLSHRFDLNGGSQLSVGLTPKMVNVVTYDYTQGVDTFEDSDIDTREKSESKFDLDFGLVYKAGADSVWQFALVGKHLIGGDFMTDPNPAPVGQPANIPKVVKVEPQIRAGLARMTERTTLAVDLDLIENDGIMPGSATQFLALGAEYDLSFLQLRGGYRMNLASSDVSDVATLGVGLGPVDLSAVVSDSTVGAYLQFGFGW